MNTYIMQKNKKYIHFINKYLCKNVPQQNYKFQNTVNRVIVRRTEF